MLVTLHVWRVSRRDAGAAMLRIATEPRRLRALPGVRFAKVLGTGRGRTFGPGDADLTRFAAVVVWDRPEAVELVDRRWRAARRARIDLRPLSSRGTWSGATPFDRPKGATPFDTPKGATSFDRPKDATSFDRPGPRPERTEGPVLALTRARLRPSRALTFWRAIPPVARELAAAPGLLARFGVGEAPIGWQGTVSVWRSAADLTAFAYRQPEHRAVIERTPADRWYAEELFARFAVLEVSGDKDVLGWREGGQADR
jgi:hypothetical protein